MWNREPVVPVRSGVWTRQPTVLSSSGSWTPGLVYGGNGFELSVARDGGLTVPTVLGRELARAFEVVRAPSMEIAGSRTEVVPDSWGNGFVTVSWDRVTVGGGPIQVNGVTVHMVPSNSSANRTVLAVNGGDSIKAPNAVPILVTRALPTVALSPVERVAPRDWSAVKLAAEGFEVASSWESAMLGISGAEAASSGDWASDSVSGLFGSDVSMSTERSVKAATSGRGSELSTSRDHGSGGFAPTSPATYTYTTVGSHSAPIPPWCRYIDLVVIGGGGGGHGAGFVLAGAGGSAGSFAWTTLERGVNIPWTLTSVDCTVGAGGAGGDGGAIAAAGSNGSPSSIAWSGGAITGLGGARGPNNTAGADRNGKVVSSGNANNNRDLLLNGVTYTGGAQSTGDTANTPGSGGRGGGAPSGNGRQGGTGQTWVRCYQ